MRGAGRLRVRARAVTLLSSLTERVSRGKRQACAGMAAVEYARTHSLQYIAVIRASVGSALSAAAEAAAASGSEGQRDVSSPSARRQIRQQQQWASSSQAT